MIQQIHHSASVALLFTAVALVFSACDSGGEGASPAVINQDTLQIGNVSPDVGHDFQTKTPTITINFTEPVVKNEFTADTLDQRDSESDDVRRLVDELQLTGETAKLSTPSNSVPIKLNWTNGRTKLEVTPQEELKDGWVYQLDFGSPESGSFDVPGDGDGFYDARFKSKDDGQFYPNAPVYASPLTFSIGVNNAEPPKPAVSNVTDQGTNDYTDNTATLEFELTNVDDEAQISDSVEIKGYEVYYKTADELGDADGSEFVKAMNVSNEASSFEDSDGIIAADLIDADASEFDDEVDTPTATTDVGYPFAADEDGSYNAITWKVRAVSINGVRGPFSDELTTEDTDMLSLADEGNPGPTRYEDTDNDGDLELRVEFEEPLANPSDVSVGSFTVADDGAGDAESLSAVKSVNNSKASADGDAVVILELGSDGTSIANDHLTVNNLTDLKGNGLPDDGDDDVDDDEGDEDAQDFDLN